MTGFGLGSAGRGLNKLNIEIKSVNSRFLEIKFRGIQLDSSLENKLKKIIEKKLYRGSVLVRIDKNRKNDFKEISFNQERFEIIRDILKNIHVLYGQRMSLSNIISTNDLLKVEEEVTLKPNLIIKAVEKALDELNEMRIYEGQEIFQDTSKRVDLINKTLDLLENKIKSYKTLKHKNLKSNIEEMIADETLDESRLIQEVAYFVEKMDISEEIIRSKSHFKQLYSYLESDYPVGKKINFLVQEIGREINTIGSKSHQVDVTIDVVEVKDELEKIREQIQNIL